MSGLINMKFPKVCQYNRIVRNIDMDYNSRFKNTPMFLFFVKKNCLKLIFLKQENNRLKCFFLKENILLEVKKQSTFVFLKIEYYHPLTKMTRQLRLRKIIYMHIYVFF